MALRPSVVAAVLAGSAPSVLAAEEKEGANPIRKVVNLLQSMQKKVAAEAEEADKLFEKYMCYCKENVGGLSSGIQAAKEKVAALQSGVKESVGKKGQLDKELKSHKVDRKNAEDAIAEATAIRTKEKAAYDKELAASKANYAAVSKAVVAISKGMGSAFLQTPEAETLRSLVSMRNMMDADRDDVSSFLQGKQESDYSPQGGEILGILKQMKDEMGADQKELIADEAKAVSNYEELMTAKKKQVSVLSKSIELKLQRVADLSVKMATQKNDLDDTSAQLQQDEAFLADLDKNCKTKKGVHEKEQNMRSQETTALADTIKILNDDEALDLFKKTLPSSASASAASAAASFVQLESTRTKAQAILKRAHHKARSGTKVHLSFISMALQGKKIGFDKVIGFIDKLVTTLQQEQSDDDDKKDFCSKKMDETEDKKKSLENALSDINTVIAEAKETLDSLSNEIQALKDGIVQLDKSVADATAQRKKENAKYKELMASDGAAKELLMMARNRMQKFYNPKLANTALIQKQNVETTFVEDEAGDQDQADQDADASSDSDASAPSFLQVATDSDGAPPPPPETAGAYMKKSDESSGVVAMMNILLGDLDKEMVVAKTEEGNDQEEYEKMIKDSGSKRAQDARSLTDKEANKASVQAVLEKNQAAKKSTATGLAGTNKYMAALHSECDWLLQYYNVRKEARADEVDALKKSKAVLKGADYSFVQTSVVRSHTHGKLRGA